MRISVLLVVLAGCDDTGPVVPRGDDGGPAATDASIPIDLAVDFPDGSCTSNEACRGDGGSRYLSCLQGRCSECEVNSDCDTAALGRCCVGNHCVCGENCSDGGSTADCVGNPNGPVCMGVPAYCGCSSPPDCPSGTCATDDYVAGFVCAP